MFSLHKKKRIVLSALATIAIVLPAVVFAANRLAVSEDTHAITYVMPDGYTAMVDPNFYDCVVAAYKSTYPAAVIPETGITDEQLLTIDTLVCNSRVDGEKITDTTGLEKMPRMAYLDLSSNNISAIDVSSFSNLTFLNLHSNQLTSIDVRNNYSLSNLYLNNNNLSSLNLSNNLYLRELDASNNNLSSLDLSNNTRLSSIKLEHNRLQYLNISNTSSWLRLLNINDNQIGFLDVSNNSNLTDFMADNIVFYAGIEPTISDGNYIYDLSGLKFVEDGEHEGFIVDFSITNTENYSYDETNKILTVNNPEGAGLYIQIEGVDNRNEGSFTYKFGLPYILTYDLNGGSGNFGPALCYPNVVDTQICLMEIADGLPTRDGYNFMGWVDPADAGTGSYFPGNTISLYQSKTIYAGWELETTTVDLDFNLNGGEGSVAAQTCETDVEHPNCTVTIPNTVPTRDGYNFLGWANSSTVTEAVYQPGSSVSLSQNKTVFAVWELAIITVTLNFDSDGGEGIVAAQSCTISVFQPSCSVTIPNTSLIKERFRFLGWKNEQGIGSPDYLPGESLELTSDKTVYAAWSPLYFLTYDNNGGNGVSDQGSCSVYEVIRSGCSVAVNEFEPTRSGYRFLGWADEASAISASYHVGDLINLNGDRTIYAVWEMINTTVNLGFDLNGGEGSVVAQSCIVNIDHPTCGVIIPNTAPTRNGYNFLGWAETNMATSPAYNVGDEVSLSGNKVLYAVWEIISTTINLDFDLNGGAGTITTQTCTLDIDHPNCTVTIPSAVPTRDGYNFLGWANSSTATAAVYQPGSSVSLNQSKTVYAVWELITNAASLGFDLNGGTGTIAAQTCTLDIDHPNCIVAIPSAVPTRDGYNFLGWANSSTATAAVYQPGGSVSLNQSKTVYAVWELITTTVSLRFDLDGGEGAIATQSCEISVINPSCDINISTSLPSKDGYRFLGWADSATATAPDYRAGDSISLSGDKTIYAIWEIADTTVSLSFNLNGGEGEVVEQSCTININNPTCVVTVPEAVPTKKNHEFLGWADDASASEESYIAGDEITLDDNKIIYAIWNRIADDDEPADDGDDIPVPDTSAPDTGVNTGNNGLGAVFTVAILPMLIGAVYIVFRRNKKSHLKFD